MTRKVKKTTPAPKAKTAAKEKKPGIIATLIELMSAPKGATIDEMVAVLVKKFPDRSADGMRNTTRVQVARQGARVEKDEAGVRRYFLGKK